MTAPVFLAEGADLAADLIVLTGAEGRHAATVRRIRPGERADVTDGQGLLAECVVTAAGAGQVELRVRARREVPVPNPRLTVVQAIPKGERAELAVETMTEVGVDVIVPWQAERCVARWPADRAPKALGRWRSAAREAAKQARRARVPEVTGLASSADVVARISAAALAIVLEPDARLAFSQLAQPAGSQPGVPGPGKLFPPPRPASGDIVLVVGPEGGISPAELTAFTDAGATPARLGESVLRTSTAGAVAAAVLMTATGRW
ncbi:MAG: 16S rRNA (uracil(1498)-N(3))-methyltransferase [Streptosporangiaceae bacterium]